MGRFGPTSSGAQLERAQQVDAAMAKVAELGDIRSLKIAGQPVTDAGLAHVARMPSLDTLDLSYCRNITDASFEHLKRLPRLKHLHIHGTAVSKDALEEFKRAAGDSLRVIGTGRRRSASNVQDEQSSKGKQEEPFSEWLSGTDYQKLFETRNLEGHYPVEVEGRNSNGENQFRAKFAAKPMPQGFAFATFHGIDRAEYVKRTAKYEQNGLREISVNSFLDASKVERLSGTWVRTATTVPSAPLRDRLFSPLPKSVRPSRPARD